MKEIQTKTPEKTEQEIEQKPDRTIAELWAESDKIRTEIIKNPLKHPVKYLKIVLFEGL